ncbi:gliding motility-associated C-terminal domain-containing protein [Ekhidna sp.]
MISVTNEDDDTFGAIASAISGNTREEGTTATFTIVLNSEPTDDVEFGLSSSDVAEGTVSPSSITFTNANWSDEQIVTVTGVDDAVDDGDVNYSIIIAPATSTDINYNGLDIPDISLANEDDENTPPAIVGQVAAHSTNEDTPFSIALSDLLVNDPDDTYPESHTLILENGANYQVDGVNIIPSENFYGSLQVKVKVSDGINESNFYDYSVDVLPVNDKPDLEADVLIIAFGSHGEGNLLINDSDIENDNLELTDIDPLPEGLTFSANGDYSYEGRSEIGVFALDYVVCDDGDPSECSQSTFTLTIEDGDLDSDGIPDSYELQFKDVDDDGTLEYLDEDSDNDGILDAIEAGSDPRNPVDTDGDGIPDFVDLDSDNDGRSDLEEGVNDCDYDEILNYVDSDDLCDIKVAVAISPNGDGKNDVWIIQGIEKYPNNRVMIFNRWGTKIYEIDGYDNGSKVWGGEMNKSLGAGNEAAYSTYYFIIDFKDGSRPLAGNILISR